MSAVGFPHRRGLFDLPADPAVLLIPENDAVRAQHALAACEGFGKQPLDARKLEQLVGTELKDLANFRFCFCPMRIRAEIKAIRYLGTLAERIETARTASLRRAPSSARTPQR
jgi:hypothetical protein